MRFELKVTEQVEYKPARDIENGHIMRGKISGHIWFKCQHTIFDTATGLNLSIHAAGDLYEDLGPMPKYQQPKKNLMLAKEIGVGHLMRNSTSNGIFLRTVNDIVNMNGFNTLPIRCSHDKYEDLGFLTIIEEKL